MKGYDPEWAMGDWADDMSEKFYNSVKEYLNPDLSDSLKLEFIASLALNYISTHECKICESCDLSLSHAFCFVNDVLESHEKEVEECFDEYMQDKKESSFDI